MAVRRRRPLVPPPYPRRNRYTPISGRWLPSSAYAEEGPSLAEGTSAESSVDSITQPSSGMCYIFVTNQVPVNFTISFTGKILARPR